VLNVLSVLNAGGVDCVYFIQLASSESTESTAPAPSWRLMRGLLHQVGVCIWVRRGDASGSGDTHMTPTACGEVYRTTNAVKATDLEQHDRTHDRSAYVSWRLINTAGLGRLKKRGQSDAGSPTRRVEVGTSADANSLAVAAPRSAPFHCAPDMCGTSNKNTHTHTHTQKNAYNTQGSRVVPHLSTN
jgi:hypothetical protein